MNLYVWIATVIVGAGAVILAWFTGKAIGERDVYREWLIDAEIRLGVRTTVHCMSCDATQVVRATDGLPDIESARDAGWERTEVGWLCPLQHRPSALHHHDHEGL